MVFDELTTLPEGTKVEVVVEAAVAEKNPRRGGQYAGKIVIAEDFDILPIEIKHMESSEKLPWLHRDPFDRLMISQALIEQATILSKDPILARYSNNVIVP